MEGDLLSDNAFFPRIHFNPLPPHGGRQVHHGKGVARVDISIHSLRMEGDTTFRITGVFYGAFQSTPSAWRETL